MDLSRVSLIYFFAVLSCLAGRASSWWDEGHMLPPTIVKLRVYEETATGGLRPEDIEKFERLAKLLQVMTELPSLSPFVTTFEWCATFPDYLKKEAPLLDNKGGVFMRAFLDHSYDHLHFANPPFPVEKCKAEGDPFCSMSKDGKDYGQSVSAPGVVWQLEQLEKTLVASISTHPNEIFTPTTFYRQFCLWLHLMGDIAQPLHVGGISQSDCFPNGDTGGNDVLLKKEGATGHLKSLVEQINVGNLHALWDSMAWYPGSQTHPSEVKGSEAASRGVLVNVYGEGFLNPNTSLLLSDAQKIMALHPYDEVSKNFDLDASYLDMALRTQEWFREVAFNVKDIPDEIPEAVYTNCGGNAPQEFSPSDAYIEKVHEQSFLSVAVAAYSIEHRLKRFLDALDFEGMEATLLRFSQELLPDGSGAVERGRGGSGAHLLMIAASATLAWGLGLWT